MISIEQHHAKNEIPTNRLEANELVAALRLVQQYFGTTLVDFYCMDQALSKRVILVKDSHEIDSELRLLRERFNDNNLHVVENLMQQSGQDSPIEPTLKFYAQYPVFGRFNEPVGILAIADVNPRSFSKGQASQLIGFSSMIAQQVKFSESRVEHGSQSDKDKLSKQSLGLSQLTQIFSQKLVALICALLVSWAVTTIVFNLDKERHRAKLERQSANLSKALIESLERLDREGERLASSSLLLQGFLASQNEINDVGLSRLMSLQYSRTRYLRGYGVFNNEYQQLAIWSKPSFDMQAYGLSNWLRQSSLSNQQNLSIRMVADTAFILTSLTTQSNQSYFIVKALNLTQLLSSITSQLNTPNYQVFLDTPNLFLSQSGAVGRQVFPNGASASSRVFPSSWRLIVAPYSEQVSEDLPQSVLIKNVVLMVVVAGFVYYFLRLPRRLHRGIRHAHQTILSREALYNEALDTLPDAFAVFDASGGVLVCNRAFESIFHYEDGSLVIHQNYHTIFDEAKRRKIITHFEENNNNIGDLDKVIDIGLNDGRWITVLQRGMTNGAFVCYFHDITDVHRREEELAAMSERAKHESLMKGRFVAQFNEQIKAPLLLLHELVEQLQNPKTNASVCLSQLDEVDSQIRCVTEQLASIEKKQSNKIKLKLSDFDVNGVIDRVIDILSTKAQSKHIELGVEANNDLHINSDEKLLSQLHLYLLTNLIESLDNGRIVTEAKIKTRDDRASLDLIYKVHGSLQHNDFCFELKAMNEKGLGDRTTLEKSLELRYLDSLIHTLSVSNILYREKKGFSRIVVSLPVNKPYISQASQASKRISDAELSQTMKGLNLLLVDDDPINEVITKNMLEQDGYNIECAGTAVEALVKASQHEYDIILMDINLPDISGVQVMRKIRRANHNIHTRIIAYTANDDTDKQYEKLGFDDYISKPVNKAKLQEKIKLCYLK
ncbi:hypothetical protein BM527_03900 [Alteromonas sp. Mex14]|nr:hypothetical protein BM527_03900 [Alteromonas sp. Mex14]